MLKKQEGAPTTLKIQTNSILHYIMNGNPPQDHEWKESFFKLTRAKLVFQRDFGEDFEYKEKLVNHEKQHNHMEESQLQENIPILMTETFQELASCQIEEEERV
jgi:hypothetical protein